MSARHLITIILFSLISTHANSDGWATFSEHEKMKGYNIVDVGQVTELSSPLNTKWDTDLYKMNEYCFSLSGYIGYLGYSGPAALLLVNAQKDIKLAIIKSEIGSLKVQLHSIRMYKCPSNDINNAIKNNEDYIKKLEQLKKELEALQKLENK